MPSMSSQCRVKKYIVFKTSYVHLALVSAAQYSSEILVLKNDINETVMCLRRQYPVEESALTICTLLVYCKLMHVNLLKPTG